MLHFSGLKLVWPCVCTGDSSRIEGGALLLQASDKANSNTTTKAKIKTKNIFCVSRQEFSGAVGLGKDESGGKAV